ncbi:MULTISPECIES: hypothetical protein, partial [Nostocaceae]
SKTIILRGQILRKYYTIIKAVLQGRGFRPSFLVKIYPRTLREDFSTRRYRERQYLCPSAFNYKNLVYVEP